MGSGASEQCGAGACLRVCSSGNRSVAASRAVLGIYGQKGESTAGAKEAVRVK